jgi:hypothetical protein
MALACSLKIVFARNAEIGTGREGDEQSEYIFHSLG